MSVSKYLMGTALCASLATTALGEEPAPAPAAADPAQVKFSTTPFGYMRNAFMNMEAATSGFSLPLSPAEKNSVLRMDMRVDGASIPGIFIRREEPANGYRHDFGYMSFSQRLFPDGETIMFNDKGAHIYSAEPQTGNHFGIRELATQDLGGGWEMEAGTFLGITPKGEISGGLRSHFTRSFDDGWSLTAGGGTGWLGEQDLLRTHATLSLDKTVGAGALPRGHFTAGVQIVHDFGSAAQDDPRATVYMEYRTRIVHDQGPKWVRNISVLFGGYAGTESHGAKGALMYTPSIGKRELDIQFGPSVTQDSKAGTLFGFEVRKPL